MHLERKMGYVHSSSPSFEIILYPALWIRFAPGLLLVYLSYPMWLYLVKQYNEGQMWRRPEEGAFDLGVLLGVCFFPVVCPRFLPWLRSKDLVIVIVNMWFRWSLCSSGVIMVNRWFRWGFCSSWSCLLRCVLSCLVPASHRLLSLSYFIFWWFSFGFSKDCRSLGMLWMLVWCPCVWVLVSLFWV